MAGGNFKKNEKNSLHSEIKVIVFFQTKDSLGQRRSQIDESAFFI